jgi:hypothetical protein
MTRRQNSRPRIVRTLVRWEFTRGQERLSCEVDRELSKDTGGLPYQKLQRGTIEFFENATAAFRRHAMLASDLRESGWKLVSYTS